MGCCTSCLRKKQYDKIPSTEKKIVELATNNNPVGITATNQANKEKVPNYEIKFHRINIPFHRKRRSMQ